MTNQLLIAILGLKGQGRIHLNSWLAIQGVSLGAVCDIDARQAIEATRYSPETAVFSNIEELFQEISYDIVDICLPIDQRPDAIKAALRIGANILCEPPFAPTFTQSEQLVQMAEDRERLLIPSFVHRFHPPVLALKDLLMNDELGAPISMRCRFTDTRNFLMSGSAFFTEEYGVLLETGIHAIDINRYLFGEVVRVTGQTSRITPRLSFEDGATLLLQNGRGSLGVIEITQNLVGARNVLEVYGSVGSSIVDYDMETMRKITSEERVWQVQDFGGVNGFEAMLEYTADRVRGHKEATLTAEDALRAQEIIETVLSSGSGMF